MITEFKHTKPVEVGGKKTFIEVTVRTDYSINFHRQILHHLQDHIIKDYAENNLEMVDEEYYKCDCSSSPRTFIEDVDTDHLIQELKTRGYEIIECPTLADNMRLEKLKEQFLNA